MAHERTTRPIHLPYESNYVDRQYSRESNPYEIGYNSHDLSFEEFTKTLDEQAAPAQLWMLKGYINGQSNVDNLESIYNFIIRSTSGLMVDNILAEFAQKWAEIDLDGAKDMIERYPPYNNEVARAICEVANVYAKKSPESAFAWVSGLGPFGLEGTVTVIGIWIEKDPEAAAEIITKSQSPLADYYIDYLNQGLEESKTIDSVPYYNREGTE